MPVALQAVDIAKRFILSHHPQAGYGMLRDVLAQGVSDLGRRLRHPLRASSEAPMAGLSTSEEFWALREINFRIDQGEVVGIIGRNGAGKSTLLKILSRITEPTSGYVGIKGRVNSLLEVGTGFHAELSGRENVFLNGSILGMPRATIREKFDEIVAFAEVEKFLDVPMKRYSSGMSVRLAFSIAAHLQSDVLIVDEVLAVGDAAFQKKCLLKMREFAAQEGRTVIFVSHTMGIVRSFCPRCLLLQKGRIVADGETNPVIHRYFEEFRTRAAEGGDYRIAPGESPFIRRIRLLDLQGATTTLLDPGGSLILELELQDLSRCSEPQLEVVAENADGVRIFSLRSDLKAARELCGRGATVQVRARVERLPLQPGEYWLSFHLYPGPRDRPDALERCAEFVITGSDGQPPPAGGEARHGIVLVEATWAEPKLAG